MKNRKNFKKIVNIFLYPMQYSKISYILKLPLQNVFDFSLILLAWEATRTGVPWIKTVYTGKSLSKMLSLKSIIVTNVDHKIEYIVTIIDFFCKNTNP